MSTASETALQGRWQVTPAPSGRSGPSCRGTSVESRCWAEISGDLPILSVLQPLPSQLPAHLVMFLFHGVQDTAAPGDRQGAPGQLGPGRKTVYFPNGYLCFSF